MGLVGAERGLEAGSLPVGEVLLPRAKDVADPIQRITSISAVSEGVVLDPAPNLVNRAGGEFDHVEGIYTAVASSSWTSMAFL